MANSQAMCTSFKGDILKGLHAFGPSVIRAATTKDSFKAALYLASGSLGAATTAYSATSEVSGTNYTAGGVAVTNGTDPATSGTSAIWTPTASIVYTTVTLATAFDAVLIYNDTAAGKNAVPTACAGMVSVSVPAHAVGTALIQIT